MDYREYTYAAGKFPGGFIKREGRMSEKEILTCRLIDRPVRPLFPEGFSCETQIIAMVLSADPSAIQAFLPSLERALRSPFQTFRLNMSWAESASVSSRASTPRIRATKRRKRPSSASSLPAPSKAIVMVEAGADSASEEEVLEAIEFGHDCCKKIAAGIRELVKLAGKPKRTFTPPPVNQDVFAKISTAVRAESERRPQYKEVRQDRELQPRASSAKEKALALFTEDAEKAEAPKVFEHLRERIFRDEMLKDRRRPDGRAFDEIRPITCEVGVLPRTHGSAIFTRGETQALVTTTLGNKDDEQRIEMFDLSETSKRFMLHYNFPPFSVGEVGFMRGAGTS